jgi:hypothetical protein
MNRSTAFTARKWAPALLAATLFLSAQSLPAAAAPQATPRMYLPVVRTAEAVASGVLKITPNPVVPGGTVAVNWAIGSYKFAELDKGDGQGFKGPLPAIWDLTLGPISQQREISLRWQDAANKWWIERVTLRLTSNDPIAMDGILTANINPVVSGGNVIASWNIPNFKSGDFDKGDGQGYKGPIAANMNSEVTNITAPRTLRLRWRDLQDVLREDVLTIDVTSGGGGTDTRVCNSSNPHWRGPTYPFCVSQDLEWDAQPVWHVAQGADLPITMRWNVYGIDGIRLRIDRSSQQCGPAGDGGRNVPVNGSNGTANATYTFNAKDFAYGGYKLELFVEKDGKVYGHNEKFLCVGN